MTKTRQRIAMIAPLPPVRSGIARHSLAVARAMQNSEEVRVWSYARQYPKALYPGEAERACDLDAPQDIDQREIIDGVNPLTWRKAAREICAWRPDLVVFPTWTFFLAPALASILAPIRRAGIQTCGIVHNAFDHEEVWWKSALSKRALAQADFFMTHGGGLADLLAQHYPGKPAVVFPHPIFDDFPEPDAPVAKTHAIDVLFFGLVRPYKGLPIALRALAQSGRKDISLTIAGEFWDGLEETKSLIQQLGLASQVTLDAGYVSDKDASNYFARTDAVVLPYTSVTGSGVVPLAYHFAKPVIASDLAGLRDVVHPGQTGWLFPMGQVDALAEILAGLEMNTLKARAEGAKTLAKALTWEKFVQEMLKAPK
ncbi:glycosyl transferase [Amylibacter marinus]|uniref:Glycosyl transferase n=1 Tax=Amylibacter marinus TaxID=1475483 RepID=A0ABQ5VUX1_9RHOB|nr:glycosyltransferase [Amylibacter marinus]GLQ34982.1 glycosyl transferase [Amylibacter marinus]